MKRLNQNTIYALAEEINAALFDNALDLEALTICQPNKQKNNWLGYYMADKIRVYPSTHKNMPALMNTLAHEMVHYYQDCLCLPTNHNGAFFKYYLRKWQKITGNHFSNMDY